MIVFVESTNVIARVNGAPCRVWEGHTDAGEPIHLFVALCRVPAQGAAQAQDERMRPLKSVSVTLLEDGGYDITE